MQHTRTVRRSSSLGAALVVLAGLIAEGADFEVDLDARTVARRLGRPLRTASAQGLLLLTRSTDAALLWLHDTSARLDSDQDFALAATILDERDLISAALWRTDFTADAEDTSDLPIATPFNTLAVGWGVVDGSGSASRGAFGSCRPLGIRRSLDARR